MPVVASCRCGQRFLAQDFLRGKQVACPACGSPMVVPSADITELAPAPLMPEPAQPAPVQPSPVRPAPLQPSPLAPAARSASARSSPLYWILGIGGGLLALVVVVLIAVVLGSSSSAKKAAKAPEIDPAETRSVAPPPPRRKAPSFDRPKPAAPAVAKSNPFESPPSAPAATDRSETQPVVDSPDFGQPKPGKTAKTNRRAPPPVATRSISALPHGLAAWHEQQGSLSGILNPTKTDDTAVGHLSWMTGLLPYLGYQEKYNELKLAESLTHAANIDVAETVIPEFQNPLDGRSTWEGYPFDGLALTHFAGMSGVEDARNTSAAKLPRSDPRAGVFGYDEVARPAAITDGTSQTIMIVGSGRLAGPWIMGGGATIRGAREPLFDPVSGLGTQGLSGGGTLVVMADGSVRHISPSINPSVFKAMCTIHGQESVDPDKDAPEFDLRDLR